MSSMDSKTIQALAETVNKKVDHFSKSETEFLIRRFNALLEQLRLPEGIPPGLDRDTFKETLHDLFGMTDDLIMDRVFRTFDRDNDGYVAVEEWIQGLSVLLRGTLEEQINYCFRVYDLNGDSYISKDEVLLLLKDGFIRQPREEDPEEDDDEEDDDEEDDEMNDLVDTVVKKMDHDKDGRLSLEDFEKSVKKEDLLLEAFGNCLPDFASLQTFEQLLQNQHDKCRSADGILRTIMT